MRYTTAAAYYATTHCYDGGWRTITATSTDLDQLSVNAMRTLAMDAVQAANSGPLPDGWDAHIPTFDAP
jgi:hypothetical protein